MILLKISGLAKSVYYYTLSKIDKDDKNKEIIDKIKEIMDKVYEGFAEGELPMLEKTDMKTLIDSEMFNLEADLGIKELNYEEATVSFPTIGSVPHQVVVIKLKESEDAVTITANIKEKIKEYNVNIAILTIPKITATITTTAMITYTIFIDFTELLAP